jgi:hypothetical protein
MTEDKGLAPEEGEVDNQPGSSTGGQEPLSERRVTQEQVSELSRARQRAQDALLRARLEGRSSRAVALARQRAQRAADLLLAARLAQEQRTHSLSNSSRRRGARG